MIEYSVVGKPVPRVDGLAKLSGQAKYTTDVVLPNMVYGKILRSPHPHAKIVSIDTSRAEKLPGVEAVITGKDTRGIRYGFVDTPSYPAEERPLAEDKVRFIGSRSQRSLPLIPTWLKMPWTSSRWSMIPFLGSLTPKRP